MSQSILNLLTQIKTSIGIVISIICSFFLPIVPLLLIVGLFIFSDTIVGIWKAKKLKERVTSRRLSAIISKMVLYQSAVILIFLMEKFIIGDMVTYFVSIPLFLTKIVSCVLCSIEGKSIDENVTAITGVSIWERFKLLLKRAKEVKKEIADTAKNND